ncbi:MAG: hypothetical protein IDH49_06875 [Gammaproteobacteria bacterium]|nr:hypothetical protein [Gammaproteobacteria bacterium]
MGAVVVLFAGVGWLVHAQLDRPPVSKPIPLTELQAGSISQIRIEYREGEIITLYKESHGWRISQPISVPANDERVAQLLRLIKAERQDIQGKELAGVQPGVPHFRVSFDDLELAFGGVEPASGRRYVLMGKAVYLISDRDYQHAMVALAELVSPLLLPAGFLPVQIIAPGVTMANGDPGWSDLADAWCRTRAFRVEGWSAESKPIGEIIVRLEPAAEFHFEIIATEPELILARHDIGMQYRLTRDQAKRLLPSSVMNSGHSP